MLLDRYDWQGALLILAGLLLNLVVCGSLMRDLEWPEDSLEYKKEKFLRSLDAMNHDPLLGPSLTSTREPSVQIQYPYAVGVQSPYVVRKGISLIEIPTFLRERLVDSESLVSLVKVHPKTLGVKELDTGAGGRNVFLCKITLKNKK